MMIPIPIGQTHHVAVGTTVLRGVRCEKCTTEFIYQLSRVGKGSGMNPLFLDEAGATREALEDAKRNLRHELEFAVDPVPCPECGHYQEDMIVPAQQQFLAAWTPRGFWISGCAIPAFLLSVSLSQSFLQNETGEMLVRVSAGVFFLGLAIVAGRWFAAVFHDPNQRSAEVRRATGREYAVTRAAFEAANPGIELPHFGARPITDITTRVPLP